MFAPMSSGRDTWGEDDGHHRTQATSSPPSNKAAGRAAFDARKKGKGKGKGKAATTGGKGFAAWGATSSRPAVHPAAGPSHAAHGHSLAGGQLAMPGAAPSQNVGGLRGLGNGWRTRLQQQREQQHTEGARRAMLARLLGDVDEEDGGVTSASHRRAFASETSSLLGPRRGDQPRPGWKHLFRPDHKLVEDWMESWLRRWLVLAILPTLFVRIGRRGRENAFTKIVSHMIYPFSSAPLATQVWTWCAMPFPDQSRDNKNNTSDHRTDGQFLFFLFWYYGVYCAVGAYCRARHPMHLFISQLIWLRFPSSRFDLHHPAFLTLSTQLVASSAWSAQVIRILLAAIPHSWVFPSPFLTRQVARRWLWMVVGPSSRSKRVATARQG